MKFKEFVFTFCLLFTCTFSYSKIRSLGFDKPLCSMPMTYSYGIFNYNYSPGSYGYYIYRNSTVVLVHSGDIDLGHFGYIARACLFIDDYTGFVYDRMFRWPEDSVNVYKTTNSGTSWTTLLTTKAFFLDAYVLNQNYTYLMIADTLTPFINRQVEVWKVSDVEPTVVLVVDDTMSNDIYINDTLLSPYLCGDSTLTFTYLNLADDTIRYYFNIVAPPLQISKPPAILPWQIYPNPIVSGEPFHLNFPDVRAIHEVSLWSASGQCIQKFTEQEIRSKTFPTEGLSPGVYFLKGTSSGDQNFTAKLLILE